MRRRLAITLCLVFSGMAALVYQVIWTRLLGFAFGTTTEAIGSVLAVFFGGMALGNWLAARRLGRVERPLRVYAWLELAIGGFALASLPLLQRLDSVYAWVGVDQGPAVVAAVRLAAAAVVLLPPTVAMGATLPVVAHGLVHRDATLGRWSAILYTANTLGAVLGAYLCGFWLIPRLGLTSSVIGAGLVNLLVAGAVWAVAGRLRATRGEPGSPAPAPSPADGVAASRQRPPAAADLGGRAAFLFFFGVSGFVAIGYEIVWSKVFGIVMEGTLYGFAAVLSSYLLGITLGSLAMAPLVDRIRDLPRAFGLLHLGIGVCVAAGMATVPYLPFALTRLAEATQGRDAVHLLFLLVAPIVIAPTALFGAAFPVLIRIYTTRASSVGEGMGIATAINTLGSIAASLVVGFWWIPSAGMDATLYALLLLDLFVAVVVLLRFQTTVGRQRLAATGGAAAVMVLVASAYGGVRVEQAIAGRVTKAATFADYERSLRTLVEAQSFLAEGKTSIVTVYRGPTTRSLRTNGMPEAGVRLAPPYAPEAPVLLGVVPYLLADRSERALVVGLGGGNTLGALLETDTGEIEVVELERGVVQAMDELYEGRPNPLDDPRVRLRVNDGRNELLLGRHRGGGRYDVIASQPSHPWLSGAANLFTREFFELARDNLTRGGAFALWVNGFRTDAETFLAILTAFEQVFPGGLLVDVSGFGNRDSLMLVGMREPVQMDAARFRERMADPRLARLLRDFRIESIEALLARMEGPTAHFAAIRPDVVNTDDNAFVEVRIPRRLNWNAIDFGEIERDLDPAAPALPPISGRFDPAEVARRMLELGKGEHATWPYAGRLDRLARQHLDHVDPVLAEALRAEAQTLGTDTRATGLARLEEMSRAHPDRVEIWRALGRSLAVRAGRFQEAHRAFARAWELAASPDDAFDAGRALHRVDPAAAWAWFDRVPEAERASRPRFAYYRAVRSLREGATRDELARARADLLAYRNHLERPRSLQETHRVLAELAAALGDEADAEHWRRLVREANAAEASRTLSEARQRLAEGRLDEAERSLDRLEALAPGDPVVAELRGRIALARNDRAGLARALAAMRRRASSFESGVAAENRFRLEHGLPVLTATEVRRLREGSGPAAAPRS